MVNVGDVIEIGGEEAVVCFKTIYEDEQYMCVAFEKPSLRYDIYTYKKENNKLMVSKVDDPQELESLLKIFTEESFNEYDVPEELLDFFKNRE